MLLARLRAIGVACSAACDDVVGQVASIKKLDRKCGRGGAASCASKKVADHWCEKCGWVCDDCVGACSAHNSEKVERVCVKERIEPKLKEAFKSTGWELVNDRVLGKLGVNFADGSLEFQLQSEKKV